MAELGNLGALLQQADDGLGEEKAVEITVDMLDYDYVKKCTEKKKLRGILERLQSGADGHYPEVSLISSLATRQEGSIINFIRCNC